MSNVEMFKYYASKLNLSKPQLEALTDCFKACFEADANGSENINPKEPDETTPSKDRTQNVSFQDPNMWGSEVMKGVTNTGNARLAKMMNGARVARMNRKAEADIMDDGRDVVNGNFHNIVNREEKRQAERASVMRMQKALNKALGINLAVDGILGPQTKDALKQYRAREAAVQTNAANNIKEIANASRNKYAGTPKPQTSDGTDWHQQDRQTVRAYHDAMSGQHRWYR